MKVKVCKCCGHPFPEEDVKTLLTPYQRRLYEIVFRAGTSGIRASDIMEIMYANDRNGGPDSVSIIPVMARNIRKRLEGSPVTMVASKGPGSRYYIVPSERKAEFDVRSRWTKRCQRIREARVV